MKQIDNLMPLATLEDLRGFCLDYTRRDKKFGNELAKFLNERFIDDEDSAADFIARLEDAFGEEKNFFFLWLRNSCKQAGDDGAADVVPHAEDGTGDGGHRIGSEMERGKTGGET